MKKIISIVILTLFTHNIFAQEQIAGHVKTYTDESGKFYMQKKLPVYIFISNSPDSSATKYLLKSKKTKEFTNPMYFDTDGFNSIRTKWAVDKNTKTEAIPKQEIIFEIYADSKSPDTYGLFNKKPISFENGLRVYPLKTSLSLLEYDAVVGTDKIYFSINEKPYSEYTEPMTFEEAGAYKVQFYGVDKVGNVEDVHVLNLIVK